MLHEGETAVPAVEASEPSHLNRAIGASVHILSSLVVIALSRDSWCEAARAAMKTSEIG